MNPIRINLEQLKNKTIAIGREGENEYTIVRIDCGTVFREHPQAAVSMKVKPPKGIVYPAVVERDGNEIVWTVKDYDLASKGDGQFQLTFTEGTMICKTAIGRTLVLKSLVGDGPAPTPIQDWMTEANETLDTIKTAYESGEFKGDKGDPGERGPRGFTGADGEPGPKGDPGDPTELIDDSAGEGDTGKTWSANKIESEKSALLTEINSIYEGKETPIPASINRLDPNAILVNTQIDTSGELIDNVRFQTTGKIVPTVGKSSVAFSGINAAGTARVCLPAERVAYYRSDNTMISYELIPSKNVGEIPENTAYLRVMSLNEYMDERSPMVEFVNSASEISETFVEYTPGGTEYTHGIIYIDEKQQEIDGRLEETELTVYGKESQNIFSGYTNQAYWRNDGSQVANNNWVASDAIDVSDYNLITYGNPGSPGSAPVCLWTDENDDVLSYFYAENGGGTIAVPNGAMSVKFSIRIENVSTFTVIGKREGIVPSVKKNAEAIEEIKEYSPVNYLGQTWDWWITSCDTDKFGNVYIGYVDTDGYTGILRRQPDGTIRYKRLAKSYNNDDHNGTAVHVLSDGKILAIGSYGHSTNNHIYCFRSEEPYSIDGFTDLSFDIPQGGSYTYRTCYSQVFEYNGVLFDFLRCVSTASGIQKEGYACLVSTNNGTTWTAYKCIYGSDPYISLAQATDNEKYLKFVFAVNPASGSNQFRGGYIDLSTQKIYDLSGTQVGQFVALDGGSIEDANAASKADLTVLTDQTANSKKGRLFYTAQTALADTVFLFAQAVDSASSDFVYRVFNNGTVIDIGNSGTAFGNVHYISGACFGKDTDTMYYAKSTDSNSDGNHELHKVKISNNAVDTDLIITEASMCIIRPLFIGNGEVAVTVGHYNDSEQSGDFLSWQLKPLFVHA